MTVRGDPRDASVACPSRYPTLRLEGRRVLQEILLSLAYWVYGRSPPLLVQYGLCCFSLGFLWCKR